MPNSALTALLQEPGLVHDQDTLGMTELLNDELAKVISDAGLWGATSG